MILLFHEGMDSKISTPARLGRELHSPRHYQAEGHFLALDGPGHIIAHDADEICKIPGYRLATPVEQDAYHASKRKASAIHEDVPVNDDTIDESPAPEQADAAPDAEHTTAPTRGRRGRG
jgi:hypothetical protein